MYDLDIRLRPEGRNAPLVADIGALRRYIGKRASLWERQSFTRMRFVCGDPHVRTQVENLVSAWVYTTGLPDRWTEIILDMRRRMEPRSQFRGSGPINLKRSAGGMVDIEFLAQMIQMKGGARAIGLRAHTVREILAADPVSILRDDEREFLTDSYARFREIEKTMRVTLEERSAIIPEGDKLERLARCYDGSSAVSFLPWLTGCLSRVRATFLEICSRLAASSDNH